LVFLDESGFLLQPLRRRVWAPRGQTPVQYAWDRHDRITALSGTKTLDVISRLSTTPFRDRLYDPRSVAEALGARYVLSGNMQLVDGREEVAIGDGETPTPIGEYYVRVKIKAIDPSTVYGPYAWGLSSHSDVLDTFNGGDGEIGIHGNNDSSVLGRDITHGCVRMDNDAITELTKTVTLGTPVDIVA
jgi:hypothetical protein